MMGDSELQGSSWILTRPADRAEVWARFLEDHGARVHCDPVLQLSPVLEPIDWTPVESAALWVFSSATTVRHFFSRLPEASVSWGEGASQPLFAAVGKATAEAIREAGHEVTFLGPGTGAVDLVTLILGGPPVESAVHVTSDAGLPVIQEGLIQGGVPCERLEVSESTLVEDLDLQNWKNLRENWSGIVYSSPATVEGVMSQSGPLADWIRSIPGVAVGARTGEALKAAGISKRSVADTADTEGLYRACVSVISTGNMGLDLKD